MLFIHYSIINDLSFICYSSITHHQSLEELGFFFCFEYSFRIYGLFQQISTNIIFILYIFTKTWIVFFWGWWMTVKISASSIFFLLPWSLLYYCFLHLSRNYGFHIRMEEDMIVLEMWDYLHCKNHWFIADCLIFLKLISNHEIKIKGLENSHLLFIHYSSSISRGAWIFLLFWIQLQDLRAIPTN